MSWVFDKNDVLTSSMLTSPLEDLLPLVDLTIVCDYWVVFNKKCEFLAGESKFGDEEHSCKFSENLFLVM